MKHRAIAAYSLGLLLAAPALHYGASIVSTSAKTSVPRQELTPAPAGPFHVAGNQLVDSRGRAFLLRGTQLTEFHPQTAAQDNRAGATYGPHSATSLSAIRLRFNMNAVRLAADVRESNAPGYFRTLAQTIRRANQMDLLVVLAAHEPGAALPSAATERFWTRCAAYLKDYPNVVFDAFSEPAADAAGSITGGAHSQAGWDLWRNNMTGVVRAIRSTGAAQPIVVESWNDGRAFEGLNADAPVAGANIVYEASASLALTGSDAARQAQFGSLAARVPMVVNGLDLELSNGSACSALPADPSATSQLLQGDLDYFDAHGISWTISTFEPGKLIKDLSHHDASTLEYGWTCGVKTWQEAGVGRILQGHLRSSLERQLFVVSSAGGLDMARGSFALAYGPILAERDSSWSGAAPPAKLGGLQVQITDARGVTRPAGMLWASAGWGQTNFVIPAASAVGPARMTIVRDDGSMSTTNITIAETAPGFKTGHSCRGPAMGFATQTLPGGASTTTPISACKGDDCRTIPVRLAEGATTRVSIEGSGFRNATAASKIEITVGGVKVPVVSFGPMNAPGQDQVTIEIPAALRKTGETDLVCRLNGRISNAVRLNVQ